MRPGDEGPDRQRPTADGCVVLAHPTAEPAPWPARVAAGIASVRASRLVALRVGGPGGTTPTDDAAADGPDDAATDGPDDAATDGPDGRTGGPVWDRVEVVTATDRERPPVRAVLAAVERHDAALVVVPGETAGGVGADAVERLLASVPCDLVVVGGRTRESGVASVLATVAGGPHSRLVLDVAGAIAAAADAWMDVLHVASPDATPARRTDAETYLADALGRLPGDVRADTWLLEAADPADAIVEQSTYYDVTVVGAPRKGKLRRFLYGSTATAVRRNAESATVTVRRGTGGRSVLDRWL